MKLIKILSDRIQIRTTQKEFEDVRINDLVSISDRNLRESVLRDGGCQRYKSAAGMEKRVSCRNAGPFHGGICRHFYRMDFPAAFRTAGAGYRFNLDA